MHGEQINPWIYTFCLVVHLIFNIRAGTSILNSNTRGFCMVSFGSRLVMFSWEKMFYASHCKLGFVIIFYYCNRTHCFLVKIVWPFTSLCKIRWIEVEITISCVGLFIYWLYVCVSFYLFQIHLKFSNSIYISFWLNSVFCPITHTL